MTPADDPLPPPTPREARRVAPPVSRWSALVVALAVLLPIAYWRSLGNGWIWDDDYYVWANPLLRDLDGLRTIWLGLFDAGPSRYALPQYYPLTHTTFWLEHHLWGEHALGYRLTNLALHAASSLLVYAILRRLRLRGAWLAALLFAVHPLHVESVAWVTERKNVLSATLGLAAFRCWLRWAGIGVGSPVFTSALDVGRSTLDVRDPREMRTPNIERPTPNAEGDDAGTLKRPSVGSGEYPLTPALSPGYGGEGAYLLGAAMFALALCAKSVVATLPAAVVVVAWWQGRLSGPGGRRIVVRMLPMLAIGASYGALTAYMEVHRVGAHGPEWHFAATPIGEIGARCQLAGRAIAFYLSKLIVPYPLMFSYPRVPPDAASAVGYFAPLAVIVVLVALWLLRNRIGRGPAAGAMLFCGLLTPALGFSNVLPMRYSFVADHFCYLASVPVLAGVAWLVDRLGASGSRYAGAERGAAPAPSVGSHLTAGAARVRSAPAYGRAAISGALVAACVGLSFFHAGAFHDARALWLDTIARNPASWLAVNNLGVLEKDAGDVDSARARFEHVLRDLKPDHREAKFNLAALDRLRGDDAGAVRRLDALLAEHADYGNAWQQRGELLEKAGDASGALDAFARAAASADASPTSRVWYARALLRRSAGEQGEARLATLATAERVLAEAVGYAPRLADAWLVRAQVAMARGDGAMARRSIARADQLEPGRADVLTTRATLELAGGDAAAAERSLRAAVAARPDAFEPTLNLAILLDRTGQRDEATAMFRRADQLKPGDPRVRARLERAP